MARSTLLAAVIGIVALASLVAISTPVRAQTSQDETPTEESSTRDVAEQLGATPKRKPEATPPAAPPEAPAEPAAAPQQPPKEKLSRIWANEPPLVRLARDKFGADFTETDAKFFAAVAANEWADFRPSPETKYDPESPDSWKDSPTLKADRLIWLCSESSAARLVPNHGIWIRGAKIVNKINLYRCTIPYSLTFYDCLLDNGLNVRNAKLQELDISNCCSARIDARSVQVAENVYLLKTAVFGGLDFIEAQIAGDLDMNGGLTFHGTSSEDMKKPGISLNLYDAKIDGDVKLGDKFRAYGRVRLTGARIGRSLTCTGGTFAGLTESAIDADRAQVAQNISFGVGFRAAGCVDIRRVHIGGDLDCDGARFNGQGYAALNADLVDIAGQLYLGDGLHADGEVRFVSAVIGKDADCDNGHFLNPTGNALSFDSTVIGRSLRIGYDGSSATDADKSLPAGFLARGCVRMYGTQVNQDLLASGGQFETPTAQAIVACNLKVASRVVLSDIKVNGQMDLSAADIEHELDLRGSQFDGSQVYNRIAIWANGMKVRGHVYCNQLEFTDGAHSFRVNGSMSFQFVAIDMSWNLYGAQLLNPGGDALEVSDCHVGGYVNIEKADIQGRVSFSRAKIDGMWILSDIVHPELLTLDMRFAHVWVIKDQSLDDWPRAGKLQLEGFVYDHFDDDSPLSVDERLDWLRRQYAPQKNATAKPAPPQQAAAERPSVRSNAANGARGASPGPASTNVIPVNYEAAPSMAPPSNDAANETAADDIFAPPTDAENETTAQSDTDAAPEATAIKDESDESSDVAEAAVAQQVTVLDPAGRRYVTQPYTQLAAVYRAIGQDEQANTVLVARAERLGEIAPTFSAQALWYRYLGRLIGYGYEPFRAIKIGIAIVAIGTLVFSIGGRRHLMAETKLAERVISQDSDRALVTRSYPRFNPLVYSLDVFLPFVDLNQICYWIPGERIGEPRSRNCLMHLGPLRLKWSAVLRSYYWFQTLAGWTLCTLLAAAVTGIVQS